MWCITNCQSPRCFQWMTATKKSTTLIAYSIRSHNDDSDTTGQKIND